MVVAQVFILSVSALGHFLPNNYTVFTMDLMSVNVETLPKLSRHYTVSVFQVKITFRWNIVPVNVHAGSCWTLIINTTTKYLTRNCPGAKVLHGASLD